MCVIDIGEPFPPRTKLILLLSLTDLRRVVSEAKCKVDPVSMPGVVWSEIDIDFMSWEMSLWQLSDPLVLSFQV